MDLLSWCYENDVEGEEDGALNIWLPSETLGCKFDSLLAVGRQEKKF
jgi:hypothetical protein